MSTNKTDALLQALQQSVDSQFEHLCIAYSGGVDSAVLLHACVHLKKHLPSWQHIKLTAIYINHGLSPHADEWQDHCQAYCEALSVHFVAKSVSIVSKARTSLEAQARTARYTAINQWVLEEYGNKACVLLGQHQDDQLETLLLQLKRGAGVQGLSGMPEHYVSSKGLDFCRPLLSISQAQIIAYAQRHRLDWIEDESNQDNRFERNFLRNDVIPLLKDKWPSIGKTANRTATICRQQSELINDFASQHLRVLKEKSDKHMVTKGYVTDCLALSELNALPNNLKNEVLRVWLSSLDSTSASQAQLCELDKICHARQDAQGQLLIGGYYFHTHDQHLIAVEQAFIDGQALTCNALHDMPSVFTWQHAIFGFTREQTQCDEVPATHTMALSVQFPTLSLRAKLDEKRPSKTIKQWLKENGVPACWRAQVPVIFKGDELVALVLADKILARIQYSQWRLKKTPQVR